MFYRQFYLSIAILSIFFTFCSCKKSRVRAIPTTILTNKVIRSQLIGPRPPQILIHEDRVKTEGENRIVAIRLDKDLGASEHFKIKFCPTDDNSHSSCRGKTLHSNTYWPIHFEDGSYKIIAQTCITGADLEVVCGAEAKQVVTLGPIEDQKLKQYYQQQANLEDSIESISDQIQNLATDFASILDPSKPKTIMEESAQNLKNMPKEELSNLHQQESYYAVSNGMKEDDDIKEAVEEYIKKQYGDKFFDQMKSEEKKIGGEGALLTGAYITAGLGSAAILTGVGISVAAYAMKKKVPVVIKSVNNRALDMITELEKTIGKTLGNQIGGLLAKGKKYLNSPEGRAEINDALKKVRDEVKRQIIIAEHKKVKPMLDGALDRLAKAAQQIPNRLPQTIPSEADFKGMSPFVQEFYYIEAAKTEVGIFAERLRGDPNHSNLKDLNKFRNAISSARQNLLGSNQDTNISEESFETMKRKYLTSDPYIAAQFYMKEQLEKDFNTDLKEKIKAVFDNTNIIDQPTKQGIVDELHKSFNSQIGQYDKLLANEHLTLLDHEKRDILAKKKVLENKKEKLNTILSNSEELSEFFLVEVRRNPNILSSQIKLRDALSNGTNNFYAKNILDRANIESLLKGGTSESIKAFSSQDWYQFFKKWDLIESQLKKGYKFNGVETDSLATLRKLRQDYKNWSETNSIIRSANFYDSLDASNPRFEKVKEGIDNINKSLKIELNTHRHLYQSILQSRTSEFVRNINIAQSLDGILTSRVPLGFGDSVEKGVAAAINSTLETLVSGLQGKMRASLIPSLTVGAEGLVENLRRAIGTQATELLSGGITYKQIIDQGLFSEDEMRKLFTDEELKRIPGYNKVDSDLDASSRIVTEGLESSKSRSLFSMLDTDLKVPERLGDLTEWLQTRLEIVNQPVVDETIKGTGQMEFESRKVNSLTNSAFDQVRGAFKKADPLQKIGNTASGYLDSGFKAGAYIAVGGVVTLAVGVAIKVGIEQYNKNNSKKSNNNSYELVNSDQQREWQYITDMGRLRSDYENIMEDKIKNEINLGNYLEKYMAK